jgi:Nif-specific regulatory protein
MNWSTAQDNSENQQVQLLMSNLDEKIFFSRLAIILKQGLGAEQIEIYQVVSHESVLLISRDGKQLQEKILNKAESVANYVAKIKRPYYSNSVKRDPAFSQHLELMPEHKSIEAELIYPIIVGNKTLATIHWQSSVAGFQFSEQFFTQVKMALASLDVAFDNLKNYLMVKYLNNELINKIDPVQASTSKSSVVLEPILGSSKEIVQARVLADKAAQSDIPVLLEGPLGSGKRFFSRYIHNRSERAANQIAYLECSVKDEATLDKELFGTVERAGMLEMANQGTLMINDINDMPLGSQAKLLQFLLTGQSMRMGGKDRMNLNVRIIATSKHSVAQLVSLGKVREDLYYRLNTLLIKLPSLKERSEDINELSDYFLNKSKVDKKFMTKTLMAKLEAHHWNANIIELKSMMERAYMLSDGQYVENIELSSSGYVAPMAAVEVKSAENSMDSNMEELTLFELEKRFIMKTLDRVEGNKTKAAKSLGITVKTLYNKLHSYGVEFER